MPKKIQRLNIVDIESTAWENGITPDNKKQRDVSEIIEIGICQVDLRTFEIVDKKSYLVKPVNYPILTNYITNLTGITNDLLDDKGTTLKYAIDRLMSEFKTAKYEWGSWGDYDRIQFEKECTDKNIQYPFHRTHTNLKYLLSYLSGQNKQRNVAGMIDYLNMNFAGNAHRGVDDAYNTALIFIEVIKHIREMSNEFKKSERWGDIYDKTT